MPVEPSSIAGAIYYVCDPSVIDKFIGLSMLNKQQRDRTLRIWGCYTNLLK